LKVLRSPGVLICLTLFLGFLNDAFAISDPSACVITIKSVELKKDSGAWITVIEPDHQVDLVNQRPIVSFFNNGRRVPPGHYLNFKIVLLRTIKVETSEHLQFIYEAPHDEISIYGSKDFDRPVNVNGQSFISVSFELDLSRTVDVSNSKAVFLPPKKVKGVTMIVDDRQIAISGDDIQMII